MIGLYNISDFEFSEPNLVSKQISQFSIKDMKFIAKNLSEKRFVTCGKENIRIWTVKNKILLATSLKMDNIVRGIVFTKIIV